MSVQQKKALFLHKKSVSSKNNASVQHMRIEQAHFCWTDVFCVQVNLFSVELMVLCSTDTFVVLNWRFCCVYGFFGLLRSDHFVSNWRVELTGVLNWGDLKFTSNYIFLLKYRDSRLGRPWLFRRESFWRDIQSIHYYILCS